jgi:hypothetical protein
VCLQRRCLEMDCIPSVVTTICYCLVSMDTNCVFAAWQRHMWKVPTDISGKIMKTWALKKLDVKIWAESIWLGTETHKRLLWIQQWTSWFHNRQATPLPPLNEQVSASEGLCSMQWLTYDIGTVPSIKYFMIQHTFNKRKKSFNQSTYSSNKQFITILCT